MSRGKLHTERIQGQRLSKNRKHGDEKALDSVMGKLGSRAGKVEKLTVQYL